MTPTRAAEFAGRYSIYYRLIHNRVDRITRAESVKQLPFETNCLKWALGYIVTNRSHTLEVVRGCPRVAPQWFASDRI